jgi:hypothetical protein
MLPRRFQNPSVKDSHFGGCPVCGRTNGCHSVGPEHWYVCHTHRTKWNVGRNLFSSWKYLTEEEHRENHELLAGYRDVRDKVSENATGVEYDTCYDRYFYAIGALYDAEARLEEAKAKHRENYELWAGRGDLLGENVVGIRHDFRQEHFLQIIRELDHAKVRFKEAKRTAKAALLELLGENLPF